MRAYVLPTVVAVLTLGACQRQKPAPIDTVAIGSPPPPPPAAPAETIRLAGAPQVGSSRPAEGPAPPMMPMIFPRTCEGEDCQAEFSALACAAVELRSDAADTAPIVARVAKGDTVNVRTQDLHVLKPGRVVVRRDFTLDWADAGEGRYPATDTRRFAAGDTVYLLHYNALGSWTWWYRGEVQSGNEFWAGPRDESLGGVTGSRDSSIAVALSHPRRESWWRVEPQSGAGGWWRADTLYSLLSIPWMQHWATGCPPWK